jgi:aminopeptidase N
MTIDQKWVKFVDYKCWGIKMDSNEKESHPLRPEILDTVSVREYTDGICYGKGAAFLKQLHKIIGEVKFKESL